MTYNNIDDILGKLIRESDEIEEILDLQRISREKKGIILQHMSDEVLLIMGMIAHMTKDYKEFYERNGMIRFSKYLTSVRKKLMLAKSGIDKKVSETIKGRNENGCKSGKGGKKPKKSRKESAKDQELTKLGITRRDNEVLLEILQDVEYDKEDFIEEAMEEGYTREQAELWYDPPK